MPIIKNIKFSSMLKLTNTKTCLNYPRKFSSNQDINDSNAPFSAKIIMVTGDSCGIGQQIANSFLKAQAKAVILADANLRKPEDSKVINKPKTKRILFETISAVEKGNLYRLFKYTKETYKNINIVINNAGDNLESAQEKNINNNVASLVKGTLLGFQEMQGTGGIILNMTTLREREPSNNSPIFNQINRFVIKFSRNLSKNYFNKPTNVNVMTICPFISKNKEVLSLKEIDKIQLSEAILMVLKTNKNGSIWIADSDCLYQIDEKQVFSASKTEGLDNAAPK
ncbi:unnamed protein product [Phyllotreta striolata]|uniref:Uncharacterized protein n=1 Tax=Phyllotreta striolata TaxID=444603 RepID=A0A9N9TQ86_PHYSR|nr:unnamed protein product [Phyllotreta striolata]